VQDQHRCPLCPSTPLSLRSPTKLVEHMAMHILHDPAINITSDPCGFCLSSGPSCSIQLKKSKGSKGGVKIDMQRSRCPNLVKLSLVSGGKSTPSAPCTNIPCICPLCHDGSTAVWKYNLRHHIECIHPTADLSAYSSLYSVETLEQAVLKNLFMAKPRWTPQRISNLGSTPISEAHSTRLVLRYVVVPSLRPFFLINNG
jgi:hypothetical protein